MQSTETSIATAGIYQNPSSEPPKPIDKRNIVPLSMTPKPPPPPLNAVESTETFKATAGIHQNPLLGTAWTYKQKKYFPFQQISLDLLRAPSTDFYLFIFFLNIKQISFIYEYDPICRRKILPIENNS